jgi:hypothetical protein
VKSSQIIRILELGIYIIVLLISEISIIPKSFGQGIEYDVDRIGGDFTNFELSRARPELCQAACEKHGKCKAWTYVKPGIQGPNARCWLKSIVPKPISSRCCISGVKTTISNSQTFSNPTIKGYRLDWCLNWATQCGEPAANAWCRTQGYKHAVRWDISSDVGASSPTYVIGDRRVCNESFCDGFSMIECALTGGPGIGVTEPQETASPQSSGTAQRTILPDGTVEIRYPDGTIKQLSTGGVTIISPNGQKKKYQFLQVQPDTPPSLPGDEMTVTWLEAHNNSLLDIIRSLVSNSQTAIDNYIQYEGTSSNLYEKINKRTQTIDYLLSP